MEMDIEKLISAAAAGLDLSKFKGNLVLVQNTENEIHNVENGGIGVQKNYGVEAVAKTPLDEDERTVAAELTPIFYGDGEEAAKFVSSIRGMKDKQITDLVARLVDERKISDKSYNRDLYKVLSGHGLYGASESNWNTQVAKALETIRAQKKCGK